MQGASGWLAAHCLVSFLGNRYLSSIFGTNKGPCVGPACSTGGLMLVDGNAWGSHFAGLAKNGWVESGANGCKPLNVTRTFLLRIFQSSLKVFSEFLLIFL